MNKNRNNTATAEEDAEKEIVKDLDSIAAELSREKELYLRLAADFENFRRRTSQESERRAGAKKDDFIRDLLPIVDNLERALAASESSSPGQLREGVKMILQQLHQLLRGHGIEPQQTNGRPFDPNQHEAIGLREDPFQPDGVILETAQPGYRRGDEVLRPAKVIVNEVKEKPGDKGGSPGHPGKKQPANPPRR
jgi:molecular chaperone GrpE